MRRAHSISATLALLSARAAALSVRKTCCSVAGSMRKRSDKRPIRQMVVLARRRRLWYLTHLAFMCLRKHANACGVRRNSRLLLVTRLPLGLLRHPTTVSAFAAMATEANTHPTTVSAELLARGQKHLYQAGCCVRHVHTRLLCM